MAGLSFSVFKDKVLSGAKRQTIRGKRKHPIKEGERLYLWWKQRTSEREKLGEADCELVLDIVIEKGGYLIRDPHDKMTREFYSNTDSRDAFAIADGFDNWQQLEEFFERTHGLPFEGVLIQWGELHG